MDPRRIPVCEPLLDESEARNAAHAVRSSFISGSAGSYLREFEERFARYCGAEHGVSVSSGTAALQLALAAWDVGPGDEVVVPTLTNIATCLAVVYVGATPVLIDCERDTWNMDVMQLERCITPRTRAIMPVHLYGHPVDMDAVMELAAVHDLLVFEDAAEAHGAEYRGRRTGGIGTAGCFSFYANKIITTGEGGMIVTDDEERAKRAAILKDLSFRPEKRFEHLDLGFNFRMTNVQAAIGVAQMQKIDRVVAFKRWMAEEYRKRLEDIEGLTLPVERPWAKNVYWMYSVLVEDEFGMTRDQLRTFLADRGVETRTFFIGMHRQPAFHKVGLFRDAQFPVSDEVAERGLYLPSGPTLVGDDLDYVCEQIREAQRAVPRI